MKLKITRIDDEAAQAYLRQLSRVTGAKFRIIVEAEAAKILEGAVSRTRAAKVSSIRQSFAARAWITNEGKRYKLSNRYPDEVWARLQASRRARLLAKLGARGLAKQSFHRLGVKAGIPVAAPGFVKKAKPSFGPEHPENATVHRRRSGRAFRIDFINSQPTASLPAAGGPAAVRSAMRGRARFFERNLKEGVFQSAAATAAKYPGISSRRAR